jgi:hypothetical protein
MSLEFREKEWGTASGGRVKIKEMTLGHLVNVLNWVHDHNDRYSDTIREHFINEANYRKLFLFANGEAYPGLVDDKWQIIDPATGKCSIEKPPEEYLEAVKGNEGYQRMAKKAQAKRVARKKTAT